MLKNCVAANGGAFFVRGSVWATHFFSRKVGGTSQKGGRLRMDGKAYFQDCCREVGIDCEKYFKVGKGKNSGGRYRYDCDPHSRKPTQLFAIKYFSDEGIYLAWNLREEKAHTKTVFSLTKKTKAIEVMASGISEESKKIEYGELGEEIVYRFKRESVDQFLKRFAPIERR